MNEEQRNHLIRRERERERARGSIVPTPRVVSYSLLSYFFATRFLSSVWYSMYTVGVLVFIAKTDLYIVIFRQ